MNQFQAARLGDVSWFKTHTYNFDTTDLYGLDVLMCAIDYGYTDIVKYLITRCICPSRYTIMDWRMVIRRDMAKLVSERKSESMQDFVRENRNNMALVLKKWIETPRSLKFSIQNIIEKVSPKILLCRNTFNKEIKNSP